MTNKTKLLLVVAMLSVAGMSIANTFVNVFLIRATYGDLSMIIIQNMVHFTTLLAAFLIGSRILTKLSVTTVYKLGIVAISLYYVGILVFRNHISTFLIPLGFVNGLGGGFFALSLNLLVAKIVEENEQGKYFSYQQTAGFILGVVTPAISGFIITRFTDLTGYYFLFLVALIFFALAVVSMRGIDGFKTPQKMRVFAVLKLKNNGYWDAAKYFSFFMGFRLAIEGQISMVFAFLIFADEQILGTVTSANALVSVISALWFAKVLTMKKQRTFYLITAIGMLTLNTTLAAMPNPMVLIIVWILFALIRNWGDTIYRTMIFGLSKRAKADHEQREYLVALEFPLCLGRIIGLSTALALTIFIYTGLIAFQILFILIGISWMLEFLVVEKKIKWLKNEC